MVDLGSNRYREEDKDVLIEEKAYRYGQDLTSSSFDLIGKNVDVMPGNIESIDILLLRFGDSPFAQIKNYYLEPVRDEIQLDDSRYESKKALLPDSEWDIDPRQIRTGNDSIDRDIPRADWDFCYTSLNKDQFEAFSQSFLGYDLEHWADREWVSHQQEYF